MPTISVTPAPSRDQVRDTGQGLITQSFDRTYGRAAGALVDGTIYFMGVGLLSGDVITNISVQIVATATSPTLSKVGLYDKAGNLRGISADQATAWASAGIKTIALTAAYTIPANDLYYLAVINKGAATPQMLQGASLANPLAVGSGAFPYGYQAAQTDLVNPATIIATSSAIPLWIACS